MPPHLHYFKQDYIPRPGMRNERLDAREKCLEPECTFTLGDIKPLLVAYEAKEKAERMFLPEE